MLKKSSKFENIQASFITVLPIIDVKLLIPSDPSPIITIVYNVPIQKFSFSESKSSVSSSLLFLVLVTESIRINHKYLDGLTVSILEPIKCFTIEHYLNFVFSCVIYN